MRRRAVALLIETSNHYARGLLEGIIGYVREHDEWSLFLPEQRRGEILPQWLRGWHGDGIIARIENRSVAKAVIRPGVPVVDVSAARTTPQIPWVETNDATIARIALDHLWERGFRSVAFCGEPWFNWSNWRCEHFLRLAQERGCEVCDYQARREGSAISWDREHRQLARWLQGLPKPVGILACYDQMGQRVLDACRATNIAVPEEVAVLGVDDDPLVCELCFPPLTSVILNSQHTGHQAARLLDQMMLGQKVDAIAHLVDPLGIRTRRSTDVVATTDSTVARALVFIRENANRGIRASDVQRALDISRRALDLRFVSVLGRTVHEEIERVRMERVRRLLCETDTSLSVIAERTGFSSESYLSAAFKRVAGITPGTFRGQHAKGT
jgi:LacI family transcriptional regulator